MSKARAALVVSIPLAAAFALVHCSSNSASPSPSDAGAEATDGAPSNDTGLPPDTAGGETGTDAPVDAPLDVYVDSGGTTWCQTLAAYSVSCGYALCANGGPMFVADCNPYDAVILSDARRQAEIACLTSLNCQTTTRHDCEYRLYSMTPATSAQQKLVGDYCGTCAPDASACTTDAVTYDVDAGPTSATPIFLAAWEYGDSVTTQIDTLCTGASLPVLDGGTCASSFAACVQKVLVQQVEYTNFVNCK